MTARQRLEFASLEKDDSSYLTLKCFCAVLHLQLFALIEKSHVILLTELSLETRKMFIQSWLIFSVNAGNDVSFTMERKSKQQAWKFAGSAP